MNVAGKRLLVVGAGRGQIGLYRAAREMGVHTIAGTLPDNDPPGIKLADEVCYMNIAKPDEVLEKARGLSALHRSVTSARKGPLCARHSRMQSPCI